MLQPAISKFIFLTTGFPSAVFEVAGSTLTARLMKCATCRSLYNTIIITKTVSIKGLFLNYVIYLVKEGVMITCCRYPSIGHWLKGNQLTIHVNA